MGQLSAGQLCRRAITLMLSGLLLACGGGEAPGPLSAAEKVEAAQRSVGEASQHWVDQLPAALEAAAPGSTLEPLVDPSTYQPGQEFLMRQTRPDGSQRGWRFQPHPFVEEAALSASMAKMLHNQMKDTLQTSPEREVTGLGDLSVWDADKRVLITRVDANAVLVLSVVDPALGRRTPSPEQAHQLRDDAVAVMTELLARGV